MGADMLIAACVAPHYEDKPFETPIPSDVLAVLNERAERGAGDLEDSELLDLVESYIFDEDTDLEDGQDEPDEKWRKRMIESLRAYCWTAYEQASKSREITTARFSGIYYWVTGGLSWGDLPTEAFGPLVVFDALSIFDTPIPRSGNA